MLGIFSMEYGAEGLAKATSAVINLVNTGKTCSLCTLRYGELETPWKKYFHFYKRIIK